MWGKGGGGVGAIQTKAAFAQTTPPPLFPRNVFRSGFFFRCVGKRDELLDLGLSPIPPGEREEKIIICTHSKTSERPNNDFPRKTKEGKSGGGEES